MNKVMMNMTPDEREIVRLGDEINKRDLDISVLVYELKRVYAHIGLSEEQQIACLEELKLNSKKHLR